MTEILLIFWVITAVWIVFAKKAYRVIIFFCVFSLISSAIYLFLGAPDVAMAEAGISAFATVFFIVCMEKYYSRGTGLQQEATKGVKLRKRTIFKFTAAIAFCAVLFWLFAAHMPVGEAHLALRAQYLGRFVADVGGQNAVTAIYLGYRVYDTLFEALLLVIAVVAVFHVSWYKQKAVRTGRRSEIESSRMAKFTMRVVCPIIRVFGLYLVLNGHISAGGGFLGGLAFASFFVCRFLVLGIYDIHIGKAVMLEEITFVSIIIMPIIAIFTGVVYLVAEITPMMQHIYLIAMNGLVGMKVACGFFVLFYRYIAIERLPEEDVIQEEINP
jgi:multicomponent Na+:H+ antiporter subunit B